MKSAISAIIGLFLGVSLAALHGASDYITFTPHGGTQNAVFNDTVTALNAAILDRQAGSATLSNVASLSASAYTVLSNIANSVAGSAAAPTFKTDPTAGMFKSATNAIGFSTDSVERWVINASGSIVPAVNNQYDIGNGASNPRDVAAARQFAIGLLPGLTTIVTNQLDGVITQRLSYVGGIILTNETLP